MDVILASLHEQGQLNLLSQVHHPCVIPMCGADPIIEVRLLRQFRNILEPLLTEQQQFELCHAAVLLL